jgi:hypothetical protein
MEDKLTPLVHRKERIADLRNYLDDIRNQVNKYYDLLMEFTDEFQSNILQDHLNDAEYLRARFKEIIDKKGSDLNQANMTKTVASFESLI